MLFNSASPIRRILCLGPHSDDIEIGCGGMLLRLIATNPAMEIRWQVFSAVGDRKSEAEASAADFLGAVKKQRVVTCEFRESYFPQEWALIKDQFERIKQEF